MYRAPDDPILFEGPADHHTGDALVVGRVTVTRQRFVFASMIPNQARTLEIALPIIAKIAPCAIASVNINGVELIDDRGATLRFLVEDPHRWHQALDAILATHGRGSAYR